MGKCNCTPLVIENHAVHKINCSTMTAQPDTTIDSEGHYTLTNPPQVMNIITIDRLEEILQALMDNVTGDGKYKKLPTMTKEQAHAEITQYINHKIAQEANKTVVAELARLTNHDNYISDAHLGQVVSIKTIEKRIAQLTADKELNNG